MIKKITLVFIFILFYKIVTAQDSINGLATRYANKFVGRKTATGEIYRHSKLTAASNNFKLGSYVRVTNLLNSRVVDVFINDKMAKSSQRKGIILDLSQSAYLKLSSIDGIIKVSVKLL